MPLTSALIGQETNLEIKVQIDNHSKNENAVAGFTFLDKGRK